MFKSIAATTLAATIAFTAGGTEARADNDDLARFLLGAATLAIIAKGLDDNNRSKSSTSIHVHRKHVHRPHVTYKHVKRHAPRRVSVPIACQRSFPSRQGGTWRVFGVRCLERAGKLAGLPRKCLRRFDRGNRAFSAYSGLAS